jgi:hypothetical protein
VIARPNAGGRVIIVLDDIRGEGETRAHVKQRLLRNHLVRSHPIVTNSHILCCISNIVHLSGYR